MSQNPTAEFQARYQIVEADLGNERHQQAILLLIDAYARDPYGDGKPLPADVRARLIPGLRAHPTTLIFLAFEGSEPVAAIISFLGFSTFAARQLINIHDCIVLAEHRGRGLGRALFAAVEQKGKALGCCKLTLEVLENNVRALKLYHSLGFARYTLQPEAGGAIFMAKPVAH